MKKILILAVFILITGLIFFMVSTSSNQKAVEVNKPVAESTTTLTPTVYISNVPDDWEKYESSDMGISFYYDPKMELTENPDETFRLILIGPSQALGTEVYDGLILTFSKGTFTQNNLKDYVDELIAAKRLDPIYTEVTNVEETEVSGRLSYKFSESALGTFTSLFVPLNNKDFLHITYLIEDPKNQGFSEILESILSSINIK